MKIAPPRKEELVAALSFSDAFIHTPRYFTCSKNCRPTRSAVARVSEAPPEISRGAPHTLLAYYYELQ